jgi:hypothetical protein
LPSFPTSLSFYQVEVISAFGILDLFELVLKAYLDKPNFLHYSGSKIYDKITVIILTLKYYQTTQVFPPESRPGIVVWQ